MPEVNVSGKTYRINKFNPKQQLHLSRRIAPLTIKFKGTQEEISLAFVEHVAKMTDSEVDAIVDPSLAVCERKIADGVWAPLVSSSGNLMYEDINAQEIFELTIAVLKANLGNFFPGQNGAGPLASPPKMA